MLEDRSTKVPDIWAKLAAIYQLQDRNHKAVEAYQAAIDGFARQGRVAEEASERSRLARLSLNRREFAESVAEYDRYLAILERALASQADPQILEELPSRGTALANRGFALENMGKTEAARQSYLDSETWSHSNKQPNLAQSMLLRRLALDWRAGKQAAVEKELQERLADRPDRTAHMSSFYKGLGRHDKVVQVLQQHLEELTAAANPDSGKVRRCRLELGLSLLSVQNWEQARTTLAPLLDKELGPRASSQELNDDVQSKVSLAECYLQQDLPRQALPWLEGCYAVLEGLDLDHQLLVLNNLAGAYVEVGQPARALQLLQDAVRRGDSFQEPRAIMGTVYNSLALLFVQLGQVEEGIHYYRKALPLRSVNRDRRGELYTRLNLSAAYSELNLTTDAKSAFEPVPKLAQELGLQEIVAVALNNRAQILLQQDRPSKDDQDQAEQLLRQAQQLARKQGKSQIEGLATSNLADLALRQGKLDLAYQQSLEASQVINGAVNPINYLQSQTTWMRILASKGSWDKAESQVSGLIATLRDLTEHLPPSQSQKTVEKFAEIQRLCISSAVVNEQPEKAFDREEQFRALGTRTLASQAALNSQDIPSELRQRLETLQQRLADIRKQPDAAGASNESVLKSEYRRALDEVESHHQACGRILKANPATLREIQEKLSGDQVLVEYFQSYLNDRKAEGPGLQRWYLAVVISRQSISIRPIGLAGPLERQIAEVNGLLSRPPKSGQDPSSWRVPLEGLSHKLWGPVSTTIGESSGCKKVVIVPSGSLFQVSFPALTANGGYLGDRYLLETSSSATSWKESQGQPSPWTDSLSVAFGNMTPTWLENWDKDHKGASLRASELTPLPASIKEAETVAALFPGEVLKEQGLVGSALTSKVQKRRILHFATHGVLDQKEPLLSGLATHEGLLTVSEIFRWKLQADLTVLSACNSGCSRLNGAQGNEWITLSKAFQVAGSRALVASMWSISDEATGQWMQSFYASLKQGSSVGEAAQKAAARVRQQHPHPFYWAPFQVWGQSDLRLQGVQGG